jgi:tyrosine-specific transport protein
MSSFFSSKLKLFQGVAFVGGIGAGILSLPFAVAQVGLPIGIPYIFLTGLLMMGTNLLIGEIIIRTGKPMQLAGLAKKYLGNFGEGVMVLLTYALLFCALLIYIIGEGETLSALFGGSSTNWSILFFCIASFFVLVGMNLVKKIDTILFFLVIVVLGVIIGNGFFHVDPVSTHFTVWKNIFLPYGVLLFAFHSATAVPEAYEVVGQDKKLLRKTIVISSLFNILMYALFAIATVGVMGGSTTAIATIGLGEKIGRHILIFGNLFAVFAMGMSFLNLASSVRDSLKWDFGFPNLVGGVVACILPFMLFSAGFREFITLIDVVGGVIISTELLMILLIYWKMKHQTRPRPDYMVHHTLWLFILLLVAFSFGTVYSLFKLM